MLAAFAYASAQKPVVAGKPFAPMAELARRMVPHVSGRVEVMVGDRPSTDGAFARALGVLALQLGRGHTKGDTIVWLPEERTLFSGDLVEYGATPYCGDAHYKDWPETLQKLRDLRPEALVPGRGDALTGEQAVEEGIAGTQAFLSDLYKAVSANASGGQSLKEAYHKAMAALQPRYGNWVIFEHCMPFNVSRAYDEAKGLDHPRIWTAERDIEMWSALEKGA